MKTYTLSNVEAQKSYMVTFSVENEGSFIRLAIQQDTKRKVLSPWRYTTIGVATYRFAAPIDGTLIVEDKNNELLITDINVEEAV